MDLLDFVNKYWTILSGIVSVAGVLMYTQFKTAENEIKMKEQNENHDKSIGELQLKVTAVEVKVDNLKDNTFSVISLMQQDIREIMTILKREN